MEQIKNLKIQNFRGIKDLYLDNLKPITIFLGENSVGKSTVLESLFMITGPNNPFISLTVTSQRVHGNFSLKEVSYLYNDADFNNIPHIEANFFGTHYREMKLLPNFSIDESLDPNNFSVLGNRNQELTGVHSQFVIKKDGIEITGNSSFERNKEGKLEPIIDERYHEQVGCIFLSSYNSPNNILKIYGDLVRNGKKDVVLEAVQSFDDRVTSIELTTEGILIGYRHLNNMVPLSIAGDGIQKYLYVAIHAFHPLVDIIIIDEIENGLHFTAHTKLWECIIKTAKNSGKQFFISTHNKETLKCLSYFMNDDSENTDILSVITLTNDEQKIVPYSLSGLGLFGAMNNDLEIRE